MGLMFSIEQFNEDLKRNAGNEAKLFVFTST